VPSCFDVSVGQVVACICKTYRHICASAAKKFRQALSLGCRNNWVLTPRADPNRTDERFGRLSGKAAPWCEKRVDVLGTHLDEVTE
jgi:hypothetical protein